MSTTDCNCNGTLNPAIIEQINAIINENKSQKGALMIVLHKVQELAGYIPYEAQKLIAEQLDVPLAEVYSTVTFYSRFTIEPVGKYKIGICLGTACYVKGSDKILEKLESLLSIKAGETTSDGLYSIDATRCVGACGLAPVMTVNGEVYGKILPSDVEGILANYK